MMAVYRLPLKNELSAWMLELQHPERVADVLSEVLELPRKTLVVVGGANGLTNEDYDRLKQLFIEIICPFAEAHQLVVIDGGTDCGVMRLMGQARKITQSNFPLVGVVVRTMVYLPGETPTKSDQAALEPNHTHFVLVPGQEWGDESNWISRVANAISGEMASATLLVNGGAITLNQDVPNSVHQKRPVLVMAESGRTADKIAAALNGDNADAYLNGLVQTGLIQAVKLSDHTSVIATALNHLYIP